MRILLSWSFAAIFAVYALGIWVPNLSAGWPWWIGWSRPGQSYPNTKEDRLVEAVRNSDLKSAKRLIAKGVDVNYIQDLCYGESVINMAIRDGHVPMIKVLLEVGSPNNKVALNSSVWTRVAKTKNEEILTIFLDKIKDVNQIHPGSMTALGAAVKGDWPYMVEALLDKGADPDPIFNNEPDYSRSGFAFFRENALTLAVKNQNTEITSLLLDGGANVNPVTNRLTPLLIALRDNVSPEIILMLIDAGANVNFQEPMGRVEDGMLFGNRQGKYPLHFAAEFADERVYSALIDAGAEIESLDWREATPLTYAAGCKSGAGVKLLLAAGANPHHTTLAGQYPLHIASQKGSLVNTQLLVESGADVNCVTDNKFYKTTNSTPLSNASRACAGLAVVEYLLEQGANPLFADTEGLTPLQYLLDNPIEEEHSWPKWKREHGVCTLEDLTANREQIIEVLKQYE